jgi:hypothetical protein
MILTHFLNKLRFAFAVGACLIVVAGGCSSDATEPSLCDSGESSCRQNTPPAQEPVPPPRIPAGHAIPCVKQPCPPAETTPIADLRPGALVAACTSWSDLFAGERAAAADGHICAAGLRRDAACSPQAIAECTADDRGIDKLTCAEQLGSAQTRECPLPFGQYNQCLEEVAAYLEQAGPASCQDVDLARSFPVSCVAVLAKCPDIPVPAKELFTGAEQSSALCQCLGSDDVEACQRAYVDEIMACGRCETHYCGLAACKGAC